MYLSVPGSKPYQVLEQLAEHNTALLFSDSTFTELVTRLAKPRFDQYRTPAQLEAFLDWLSDLGEWVVPNPSVNACRDSEDNRFLSLAISGAAECLISGVQDLLVLHPFENIYPDSRRLSVELRLTNWQ